MNIISIKRKNYSWNYDEKKRDFKNPKYSMEATINNSNVVIEYKDENRVKVEVFFQILIKQEEEIIAEYKDNYHLVISDKKYNNYSDEEAINDINLEKEIMSIVEPYIRMNFEKPLEDGDFPTKILGFRFWEDAEYFENEQN
ncbi:hypothetical protein [Mammaliicoccus sciuri]|uniref:hypothetical protein n=1 Tax=Mammaliicoccus sciuri TaxID=1296 RepID=UPI00194FAEF1|nr:hypothetical protein [Mammaliicoccus sciuri]